MEKKILGSSPTIERMKKLISDYYFGSTITLHETIPSKYEVHNLKGKINNVQVTEHKGRYKFYQIN